MIKPHVKLYRGDVVELGTQLNHHGPVFEHCRTEMA